ncbi:hypothetical protein [Deinococcus radiotolerans]|uniref:Uncharacterized protein n=1 Tax=Deinococcus radiotolerans TaxID=1309407 RepID=A0ABQ2FR71_9DEIO|nr:hypothetical protein [Deinococcus radiotolerans]GGL18824.1 hypothetical protein GCM10010844_42170 [Deinococcus radiotolerans]
MPLTLITLLLTTLLCSASVTRPPGAPDAARVAPAVLCPVTGPLLAGDEPDPGGGGG